MEYVLIGLVSAFNMLIIKFKCDKKRYEDACFDAALMTLLAFLFSGSYGGMVVAMVGSLAISIFLFISPPTFTKTLLGFMSKEWKQFEKDMADPTTKLKDPTNKFDL